MFPKGDFSLENFSSKYDPELCGKWKVLKPLLEQWKKAQFKVLLFSQSTKMMDILEYWLQQDFPEFVRLDGSVAIRERFKRVDEFQTDPSKFIFLASIKAAGVGLNLTAANKVVPSWNPSHDAQAMDRVVRIGQKREVECIRLISSGTTEELIYHRQLYKQGLSEVANTGKAPSR
ncbi:excision repair cross-complementing rodent repair deficiency complementation group [Puccinia graminis f. sp. tritici]|nr:excision repair cross-complementing rodent repair deficiency complementation group [Puccinia graminis f. sp. tritici]